VNVVRVVRRYLLLISLRFVISISNLLLYKSEHGNYCSKNCVRNSTLSMSDFPSNLPSSGSKLDSSKKEQLMEQVKAQIAVANAQEILHVSLCLSF